MQPERWLSRGRPVALVTGSSSGIGAAIASELGRRGFDLAINGTREAAAVEPLLKKIRSTGSTCSYVRSDISTPQGRALILAELKQKFGRVDLLVNNAGIAPQSRVDIMDLKEESFDRVMSVNLKGTLFLTQQVAKWMIDLKAENPGLEPKIINISSISSYASSTVRAEYCVSKAAVSMVTRLFADRLAEHGINVYEIRPGIIRTPMTEPVREKYDGLIAGGLTPIKRWGEPGDVAKAVAAIAEGCLPFSTGEVLNVDGGFHLRRL